MGISEDAISIEDIHADVPEFRRVYTKSLNKKIIVKVTIRTFLGKRMADGELTQPNGRWLIFDPDAVADKILDEQIAKQTQAFVDAVFRIDETFIASDPNQFVDEKGRKWVRAPN